jgi:hypothetical protein
MVLPLMRKVVDRIVLRSLRRMVRGFEEATHFPGETQNAILQAILRDQADTGFGRDHGFASINSLDEFRRRVPVACYDYVQPYIDRVRAGDTKALIADSTIHMFALTSGTTATRKFIPVTGRYLADYKRGWNIWGMRAFDDHPTSKLRPILQVSGDWQEFRTAAGIPCGSVSGLTASMQKSIVRWLYCVPACAGTIKDAAAKYYVVLRLSMGRDVGTIITANPSSLVNLARAGDRDKESLIRDLHDGTLSTRYDVPGSVRDQLARLVRRPNRAKARQLEAIAARTGHLYPRDYWKNFIIGNWTGGTVGLYLRHFPQYFGDAPVRDIGLLASEGRMTIPVEDSTTSGVLDVTSHYFEFIPEAEARQANPVTLTAEQVQVGQTYYILPTTAYGLYRYHISDLVRVTGFYNRTPLVEFLSKGAHFANLTGEKISEYQVASAMQQVMQEMNLTLTSFSLAPCWNEEQPYYGLFVERGDLASRDLGARMVAMLDRKLSEINIEYAAKRNGLRLGPPRLQLIADQTWQEWDRNRLEHRGGTLEQYKHPCLISDPDFRQTIGVIEEWGSIGDSAA